MTSGRMLLVHAHPDDESITTGGVMARYAAGGVGVTLLTCTLGEEGEILVPALEGLAAGHGDQLGGYRIGELADAMRALGVPDHRFLGGAGRFRDSGMAGSAGNDHPRAFWRASKDTELFDEAVGHAVAVIREVRPHVLITYDGDGDYGHPDHVMAHRVAMAAIDRAAGPAAHGQAWRVPKVYWTATPRSVLAQELAAVRADADVGFASAAVDELTFGVDDDAVTTAVDVGDFVDAKLGALSAHRTQVIVRRPFYALSNLLGRQVGRHEYFRLVRGEPAGECDDAGREQDLFAGLGDELR